MHILYAVARSFARIDLFAAANANCPFKTNAGISDLKERLIGRHLMKLIKQTARV